MSDERVPAVHQVEVVSEDHELRLRLVCHAVEGSPCRVRPADLDVEEWSVDYEGEMIPSDCWATTEWVEAAGWDDAIRAVGEGVWASIPVSVGYDECVVITPIQPHSTLDFDRLGGGDVRG